MAPSSSASDQWASAPAAASGTVLRRGDCTTLTPARSYTLSKVRFSQGRVDGRLEWAQVLMAMTRGESWTVSNSNVTSWNHGEIKSSTRVTAGGPPENVIVILGRNA